MSRPKKKRCIYNDPGLRYFKPRGIPLTELDIIHLGLDEYEAIRLSDLLGMSQIKAAENMNISRGTYQRILKSAHGKIAEALAKNSAIELKGGNVEIKTPKSDNL
ncbi:MAG: DUF134 domain-containing protein [Actinobacteria bacterium]|nr:DUF134 domain-containing protein [Actinomycetota bacterium]